MGVLFVAAEADLAGMEPSVWRPDPIPLDLASGRLLRFGRWLSRFISVWPGCWSGLGAVAQPGAAPAKGKGLPIVSSGWSRCHGILSFPAGVASEGDFA